MRHVASTLPAMFRGQRALVWWLSSKGPSLQPCFPGNASATRNPVGLLEAILQDTIIEIDICCDSILSTKINHSIFQCIILLKINPLFNQSSNVQSISIMPLVFSQSWTNQLSPGSFRPVLMLQLKRFDFKYGQILDLQFGIWVGNP